MIVARRQFREDIADIPIEKLVFLDEAGAKTNMTRLYGRAPRGERCHFAVPQGHWHTSTMLNALRCTGVIPEAALVFDGATDALIFRGYVERMLAPALTPGDVLVLDNLPAHKVSGVREAIEAVGARIWYLPPYFTRPEPHRKNVVEGQILAAAQRGTRN